MVVIGLGKNLLFKSVLAHCGKTTVCSSGKYPKKVQSATGGVFDENLLICGGTWPATKECHIMGKDMTWSKHADMKESRHFAASTVIQDYLWVTGGIGGNNTRLDTTEKIHLNGTVEPGINLPFAIWGHCMVQHQNEVYILGGFEGNENGNGRRKDVLKFLPEMVFTQIVIQGEFVRKQDIFAIVQSTVSDLLKDSNPLGLE